MDEDVSGGGFPIDAYGVPEGEEGNNFELSSSLEENGPDSRPSPGSRNMFHVYR